MCIRDRVWNEPNLCGFWENADMQEYFKLFHRTFDAIKEVNPGFRVGGPADCGGTDEKWIQAFMEYCHENHIPVDFVTSCLLYTSSIQHYRQLFRRTDQRGSYDGVITGLPGSKFHQCCRNWIRCV